MCAVQVHSVLVHSVIAEICETTVRYGMIQEWLWKTILKSFNTIKTVNFGDLAECSNTTIAKRRKAFDNTHYN
jgi:hypothetical protein